MRTRFPAPTLLLTTGALASLALVTACTGELEPENAEEGMIPTEITADGEGNPYPVDAMAPGVGDEPEGVNANSAETDQPTVGAGSVDSDMLASDAEPGQPIRDAGNTPDNRAID